MSVPPGPAGARTVDDLTGRLRELRAWAGVSYREVHRQVVRLRRERGVPELPAYNTVYRALQPGRSRLDVDLVTDIATVLLRARGAPERVDEWRQAYQAVLARSGDAAVVAAYDDLPEDLAEFTGRGAERERLLAADPPPVTVIAGMAGVGKTTLAVHVGHRLRFADVRLMVDLRGFHPELPPADPAAVLEGFLRRLGVAGERIHGLDSDGRVAEYRRLLAGRRALVVLDNAASEEQVRPLLPYTDGCVALVTSRHTLAGLPGARVELDVFGEADALDLLVRVAGPERIAADRPAATRIAEALGRHPLALGLVAARIRSRPDWSLADHAARVAERRGQLRLDQGVEVALGLSYEVLAPAYQRMLRLLALHPGADWDAYAAAALAATDLAEARAQVDALVESNLVRRRRDRYAFHDLVRVHAVNQARDTDPASGRQAALTRLYDHYRHTAARAVDSYAPYERHRHPKVPDPGTPTPELANREAATAWLEAERATLVAVAETSHGPTTAAGSGHAGDLSALLFRYLDTGAHHRDAEILHGCAARTEDPAVRATALGNLGVTYFRLGRYDDAIDSLRQGLAAAEQAGDLAGQGRILGHLGSVSLWLGRFEAALDHHERAVTAFRAVGDRIGEGINLGNLGNVCWRLGRYDEALGYYRQDLAIALDNDDQAGAAVTLSNLGATYHRLGRYEEAVDHHLRAIRIAREVGDRTNEGRTLGNLAQTYHLSGRLPEASDHYRQALTLVREIGDQQGEADILNGTGACLRDLGSPEEALEHHRAALELAGQLREPAEQARAYDGIGSGYADLGDADAARTHWRRALAIYTETGMPEADEVAARLGRHDPR
ncbi:MAG: ATP-binding protein [Micromonosporaceae bacterium]